MSYEILNRTTTIHTLVKYTFPDGTIEEINVSHFQPESEEEIIRGVENRYTTEAIKHPAPVEEPPQEEFVGDESSV